jgi:transcription elongation factor
MSIILKSAGAAALVGAVTLASMTSSEARNRWIGPAAAGFAAGAIVGSAATAYGSGYYSPGYAYGPAYETYAYETPAYDAYAYEAAPVYVAPRRYYRSGSRGCVNQGNYGQSVDESACNR